MTTKKRKAAEPKSSAALMFDAEKARRKLQEVHTKMYETINLLKMIDLTADQLAHGEVDDPHLIHAICTASQKALNSINDAYDMVDKVSMGMVSLWSHQTTSAEVEAA